MAELEEMNIAIALANDEGRDEALGLIGETRVVEAMQEDIEIMTREQHQKDTYIGQLVSDNKWLLQRVQIEEAKLQKTYRVLSPADRNSTDSRVFSPAERENSQRGINGSRLVSISS